MPVDLTLHSVLSGRVPDFQTPFLGGLPKEVLGTVRILIDAHEGFRNRVYRNGNGIGEHASIVLVDSLG